MVPPATVMLNHCFFEFVCNGLHLGDAIIYIAIKIALPSTVGGVENFDQLVAHQVTVMFVEAAKRLTAKWFVANGSEFGYSCDWVESNILVCA